MDKDLVNDLILEYAHKIGETYMARERAVSALTVTGQQEYVRQGQVFSLTADKIFQRIQRELDK